MGQMLNENDAIMTHDGRLALCIRAYKTPSRFPYPLDQEAHWSYDMFDEGHMYTLSNVEVRDELETGGRVIIMDI